MKERLKYCDENGKKKRSLCESQSMEIEKLKVKINWVKNLQPYPQSNNLSRHGIQYCKSRSGGILYDGQSLNVINKESHTMT